MTSSINWAMGIYLGLAVLAGCDSSAPPHVQELVRDSAGIAIFESDEPSPNDPDLELDDIPTVSIGVADGDVKHQLYRVRGARVLSDESILVLNAGTHELHRFDPRGKWLSSSGGHGQGPGEFDFPVSLFNAGGDTSAIFDIGVRRLYIVDPAGQIVASHSSATNLSGLVGLLDYQVALVAEPRFPRGVFNQIVTAEVTVGLVSLATGQMDTLMVLPGPQEYRYTHGELIRTVRVPFADGPTVRVRNGLIYVTDGMDPEVRVYDGNGELRRIFRVRLSPNPLTTDEWERTARALETSNAGSSGESRLSQAELARRQGIIKELSQTRSVPYFDWIDLNDGDNIWVRHASPLGSYQRWTKIDKDGRASATASLHPSIFVRQITESWILGQHVDHLGVERVVRYALRQSQ